MLTRTAERQRSEWAGTRRAWVTASAVVLLLAWGASGSGGAVGTVDRVPGDAPESGTGERGSFPRLANIYFPSLRDADLEALARWDLLVLAKRAEEKNREELKELRFRNPDITLLAHMAVAYHGDYENPTINSDMGDELHANGWWLTDCDGEWIPYCGRDHLLNITTLCPKNAEGERLCDWLPDFIAERLAPGGLWDGVYLDCCWDEVAWYNDWFDGSIDADGDGVPDDPAELNAAWREGMALVVERLRELVGDEYIIATNGNNTHYESCNGSTRENFPYMHGDWYENIVAEEYGYLAIDSYYRAPVVNVINTIWKGPVALSGPVATPSYQREFLFTFASTLVYGDGYFSFDGGAGLPNHSQTWWHELYDIDLGMPLGRAEAVAAAPGARPDIEHADMIRRRRFNRGIAVVNPTECAQTVMLGGVYFRSDSWNGTFYPHGESVVSVEIGARSGGVLVGSGKACAAVPDVSCRRRKGGIDHVEWGAIPEASSYSVYRTVNKDGHVESELLAVVEDAEYTVLSVEDAEACVYRVAAIDEIGCEGQPSCPAAVVKQLGSDPSMPQSVQVWDGAVTLFDGKGGLPGSGRAGVASGAGEIVTVLRPCYPNPVRDRTTIAFEVGDEERSGGSEPVRLSVYDVAGRRVRTLVDEDLPAGSHSVDWDVRGTRGARVASGCYFAVLRVGGETRTGKILVTD